MSKSKSRRYSTSEESVDSAEEERKRDLKERDEFADRLKKKDEGKTRKVVEVRRKWQISVFIALTFCCLTQASDRKGYEEAAKRLKLENEDRDKILPQLRIQSRRKYLEKRKDDKVAELEADIADDEYLFDDNVYAYEFASYDCV